MFIVITIGRLLCLSALLSVIQCNPIATRLVVKDNSITSIQISFDTNVLRGWKISDDEHSDAMLTAV